MSFDERASFSVGLIVPSFAHIIKIEVAFGAGTPTWIEVYPTPNPVGASALTPIGIRITLQNTGGDVGELIADIYDNDTGSILMMFDYPNTQPGAVVVQEVLPFAGLTMPNRTLNIRVDTRSP